MDAAAKQQIVERLRQANNVLVTVSNNPTVDQLAACIGTTLLLNKLQKHATAVFSGQVPSTLEFLQPEKTIEKTTDSLRDFIISLDKSKADKLRYKVEDQVVRIFITPYRSKISQQDLVFSEGDFNVEVVLALGVQSREQIDAAISAHGRILHDATVISVVAGNSPPTAMGQINWQDPAASSLSEMIVSISEAFGTGLIDGQMATAFLTGIVAETDRFSNEHTSPRVMTMSAQLMAAGANQQLIATKLDETAPVKVPQAASKSAAAPAADSGLLNISHEEKAKPTPPTPPPSTIKVDGKGNLVPEASTPKPPTPKPPMPPPLPPVPKAVELPPLDDARGNPLPKSPPPAPKKTPPPPQIELKPLPLPPTPPRAATGSNQPKPPSAPPPFQLPPMPPTPPTPPPAAASFSPGPTVGGHAYIDSRNAAGASLGGAFSSVSSPTARPSLGGVDPSGPPEKPADASLYEASPAVATATSASVDSARNAVASAIESAPFDPAFDRMESLGSKPLGSDIRPPEPTPLETPPSPPLDDARGKPPPPPPVPNNDTPSLELPINGNNAPTPASTAPQPPVPPPLP